MMTILKTMLRGLSRDIHTLVWNIAFPVALLVGLGLYFNQTGYSYRVLGGVLTTNVLFGATIVTAFYVMSHRNRGVYKLLRATPFSTLSFITATTGARTVLMLAVSGCVLLVGAVLLGTRLSLLSLLLVLAVLLVGTVCFTAIGFIAANLSRDESNVNMISNLIGFPMLFTSEAFYSLAHAPKWVVFIGNIQPFHYLVEAMRIAVFPGEAVSAIWLPFGILAGFTVVCVAIAVATFRWDSEKPGSPKKQKTRITAAT